MRENYHRLVVPAAKLMKIGEEVFTVEKRLDVNTNRVDQEFYFTSNEDRLDEAVAQLRDFILKTKQADVEYRNNPVVGDPTKVEGPLSIALIDLELTESEWWGLIGYEKFNRTGLMGCVGERHAKELKDFLIEHYKKRKDDILSSYNKQVIENFQLMRFYREKNITEQRTPIDGNITIPDYIAAVPQSLFDPNIDEKISYGYACKILESCNRFLLTESEEESLSGFPYLKYGRRIRLTIDLASFKKPANSLSMPRIPMRLTANGQFSYGPVDAHSWQEDRIKGSLGILKVQKKIFSFKTERNGTKLVMHIQA